MTGAGSARASAMRAVGMPSEHGLQLLSEAFGRNVVELRIGHLLDGETAHVMGRTDAGNHDIERRLLCCGYELVGGLEG